jgi:hypothetical protein
VTWGFPKPRPIEGNASISNSVQIRLQHDASYLPTNLNVKGGVLPTTNSVVSIVTLPIGSAASASATKS